MVEFCKEHSEVMRCLGALETGQQNMAAQNERIEEKIDKGHTDLLIKIEQIRQHEAKKGMADAVLGTKIGILFWVLTALGLAGIGVLTHLLLKALGWR